MDKNKVNTYFLANHEYFDEASIPLLRQRMEEADDSKWPLLELVDLKSPYTALMLSIFGGPIGVDRFYIGQNLLGVLKTLTCGGLIIWAFIDQFLIRKTTRERNTRVLLNTLQF